MKKIAINGLGRIGQVVTREDINTPFAQAAGAEMNGIIDISTEQLVSSGIIGNP